MCQNRADDENTFRANTPLHFLFIGLLLTRLIGENRPTEMVKIATWVWLANLDALLDEIQHMSGDCLDEGLLKILRDDIEGSNTDGTPERWASAVFSGPVPITAWLGIDQGTDVLQVRLNLPDELAVHAETLLHVMQQYRLVR